MIVVEDLVSRYEGSRETGGAEEGRARVIISLVRAVGRIGQLRAATRWESGAGSC